MFTIVEIIFPERFPYSEKYSRGISYQYWGWLEPNKKIWLGYLYVILSLKIFKIVCIINKKKNCLKSFSLGCLVIGSSLLKKKEGKLAEITTHCHSLSLVALVVVIRCTTCCITCCHSLLFVVTQCHSLLLDVSLVCLFINDNFHNSF